MNYKKTQRDNIQNDKLSRNKNHIKEQNRNTRAEEYNEKAQHENR